MPMKTLATRVRDSHFHRANLTRSRAGPFHSRVSTPAGYGDFRQGSLELSSFRDVADCSGHGTGAPKQVHTK